MQPGNGDFDWYPDHVVVPERAALLGPARRWQLAWTAVANSLAGRSAATDLALRQGFVLTHGQARELGLSNAYTRRMVRRGEWSAPRRGVLSVLPMPTDGSEHPHGLRPEIRASALALADDGALSHDSSAAAHGLARYGPPNPRPIITRYDRTGRGADTSLIRAAALHKIDIGEWFGTGITTVARTVVDLARRGVRGGLVAADAALHESLCTLDELAAATERATGWPGVRTARRVLALACAAVESPLESLSRLVIDDGGLPLPQPQVWIQTAWGRYRVDGLWAARRVVLEADGMIKYGASADVSAEKRRQEHLERAGYRVVRITWDDVTRHQPETIARIAWSLRAGGSLPAAARAAPSALL